jgi:hypothetical protein
VAQNKTLSVRPGVWSEHTAALLSSSVHDRLVGIGTVEASVISRHAELFHVRDEYGALVCAYVLQVNACEHGRELVVVAAAAKPGYSFTRAMIPYIELQAAAFDRVRISASRPGMGRLLSRLGYSAMATTFVKDLHHVS